MNQRIIYPNDEGGVSIIVPSPNCGLTIEEIAVKDVPPVVVRQNGEVVSSTPRPYQIVDVENIPSDRTFRNAWTYEE
jgi:hypothetical protein